MTKLLEIISSQARYINFVGTINSKAILEAKPFALLE